MDLSEIPDAPFRRHPWEVARARFFRQVVCANVAAPARPLSVLDVGAGDGYLARELLGALPTGSRIVCSDVNYTPAHLDQFRKSAPSGLSFARESPAERFDLIMLLDVLEHVPDDRVFLRGLLERHLGSGGCVLASVPAWPPLFTQHDVALGHYRRYTPAEIAAVIGDVRLAPVIGGGLFHSLLLPRALAKVTELARGVRHSARGDVHATGDTEAGQWRGGRGASALVDLALAIDNAISRAAAAVRWSVPGLSTWMLARLP